MIRRSWLFAPANHERHATKALQSQADIAVLDLEDAVAAAEKATARQYIVDLMRTRSTSRPQVFVRVNPLDGPFLFRDLQESVIPGIHGLILPKVESASDLATVDWVITQLERERGLTVGSLEVVPLVETARGLAHVAEIAQAPARVRCLGFGAGDFSTDTLMEWSDAHGGLMWARTQLVVASRAAGLAAPIDSVFPVLDDEPSLLAETQVVKRLGYQGKFCIHPRQITVVNAVFTPSADEVRLAQEIVAAWRRALAAGSAAIRVRGMFVDYPVAQRAESVLRFASRLGVYPENVNPAEHPQSLEGEDDRVD